MEQQGLRFPLFIQLEGKRIVVAGAGTIAARRVKALLPFGGEVTVIAPEVCPELEILAQEERIHLIRREYRPGDVIGAEMAIAAASSREANRLMGEECRRLGIPVSVADCREECSFYFPSLAIEGSVVVGMTSGGEDHRLVKELAAQLRSWLRRMLRPQ